MSLLLSLLHRLTYTDADAIFLLQSPSKKRKRGQSDSTGPSIAWIDTSSASYNKSSSWNVRDKSRQVELEVKVGANQRNSYHSDEVNVLITLETDSDIHTSVLDIENNNDTNDNSSLSSNDVDYDTIVKSQN